MQNAFDIARLGIRERHGAPRSLRTILGRPQCADNSRGVRYFAPNGFAPAGTATFV
jgi:hypothetical protein